MSQNFSHQLAELQRNYAVGLLDKIDDLDQVWKAVQADEASSGELREFHRLTHKLAGSGKTFGFPGVSAGAQGIERIVEGVLALRSALSVAEKKKISRLIGLLREAAHRSPVLDTADGNIDVAPLDAERERRTILVVDDDLNIRSLLKLKLTAVGFNVITAFDGQEGFAKALSDNPDLIVTDHVMPNASSIHMLSNIRGNKVTKDIPAIILTGQKLDGRRDHALERELTGRCGAVSFLEKPLDFDSLLKQIKRVIPIW